MTTGMIIAYDADGGVSYVGTPGPFSTVKQAFGKLTAEDAPGCNRLELYSTVGGLQKVKKIAPSESPKKTAKAAKK